MSVVADDFGYFANPTPTRAPEPSADGEAPSSEAPRQIAADEPDLWSRFLYRETSRRTAAAQAARQMEPLYDAAQVLICVLAIPFLFRIARMEMLSGRVRLGVVVVLLVVTAATAVGIGLLLPGVEVPRWMRMLAQAVAGLLVAIAMCLPLLFLFGLVFMFW